MEDSGAPGGSCRGALRPPPSSETSDTGEHRLIRACSIANRALVDEASDLLHKQWPRGGSPEQYRRRCLLAPSGGPEEEEKNDPRAATTTTGNLLPCSYLLVDASETTLLA